MKRNMVIVLITFFILLWLPNVSAFSQYLESYNTTFNTNATCGICHVNPAGGGPRTPYGLLFENQPDHATNPGAALLAIGVSPGMIIGIVDIENATIPQNDTIIIPITVQNVNNLAATTISLNYDPNVVNILNVTNGDLGTVTANIDNTIGKVVIATFSITPKSGNILIANLVFKAIGQTNSVSPLILSVQSLNDSDGNAIPYNIQNGIFTIFSILKGDVNGDGQIDISDALFIAQYTAGLRNLSPQQMSAADVDCDGTVNIVDALFVAQYVVGLRQNLCTETSDSATVINFNPQRGTRTPGNSLSSSVDIKNTGTSTKTFWVDLSYQKPDGSYYVVLVHPQQTNSLTPNSHQILTFDSNLPPDAPAGTYNAITAIWDGYNPNTNSMIPPEYDRRTFLAAFTVSPTCNYGTIPPTISSINGKILPSAVGWSITINGNCFGNLFPSTYKLSDGSVTTQPSTNTPAIILVDQGYSGTAFNWGAGFGYDTIGIFLNSWTDNEITINGFGSSLYNYGISTGDQIFIYIVGPNCQANINPNKYFPPPIAIWPSNCSTFTSTTVQ